MMTPAEVRQMMSEYRIPGDAAAIFADTSHATISKWTRGLLNVSDELAERIECAVSAMAAMSHYFDLPIRWSEVDKLRPIVQKYMAEHRAYVIQQRAEEHAAAKSSK